MPDAAPAPPLLNVTLLLTWFAEVALPDKLAVIVPAEKLPLAFLATIVDTVLALVAFEVTVNVEAPLWLAVNVAEPESPTPDTPILSVPLNT